MTVNNSKTWNQIHRIRKSAMYLKVAGALGTSRDEENNVRLDDRAQINQNGGTDARFHAALFMYTFL